MEQHSSSLKVAGSSQKYSATALLRAFSSCMRPSTSASLASALWEMTNKDPDCKNHEQDLLALGGTCWGHGRKTLPEGKSPFLAGRRSVCCCAISLSRPAWLCYKSLRWPPLCKFCKSATFTAAKVTLQSGDMRLEAASNNQSVFWGRLPWRCPDVFKLPGKGQQLCIDPLRLLGWKKKTRQGELNWPLSGTALSHRATALAHLGNVVHEVHARLVGFGVRQLEKWGHPEADGVCSVTTLNHTWQWRLYRSRTKVNSLWKNKQLLCRKDTNRIHVIPSF